MFCVGTASDGQPTVLGESGLMGDSRTWNDIFYAVAERTRVCAYDRAGLNLSPPAPGSARTLQDQVDDLHALIGGGRSERSNRARRPLHRRLERVALHQPAPR